jgi:cation transport regulator
MPYKNIEDLPERVQDNLPKHAQEIYLKAFNSAWD